MTSQEFNAEQIRLSEAKKLRKKAEEDSRLLTNRIALLKQEELKALKKIEETRRKAQEIMDARKRNFEEQQKREEMKMKKFNEENLKSSKTKQYRDQIKSIKQQANLYKMNKIYLDSQNMKLNKELNKRTIEDSRNEELLMKMNMKNNIKKQQQDALERRFRIFEEKKEKARIENEKKIEMEMNIRREKEDFIAKMEQEELELIQRLQNTQLLQKNAYDDLENALNGRDSTFQ